MFLFVFCYRLSDTICSCLCSVDHPDGTICSYLCSTIIIVDINVSVCIAFLFQRIMFSVTIPMPPFVPVTIIVNQMLISVFYCHFNESVYLKFFERVKKLKCVGRNLPNQTCINLEITGRINVRNICYQ